MEKKEIKHTPARFKAFEFLQVKGMTHDDIELYASAPELVEALKYAWKWIHFCDLKPNQLDVTREEAEKVLEIALAKAEGKA